MIHVIDVKVYAGNAGPFLYGCIWYEMAVSTTIIYDTPNSTVDATLKSTTVRQDSESGISSLVIGLVVGLGVLVILLIIIIVVCLCKLRRATRKKIAGDAVKMSQISSEQ